MDSLVKHHTKTKGEYNSTDSFPGDINSKILLPIKFKTRVIVSDSLNRNKNFNRRKYKHSWNINKFPSIYSIRVNYGNSHSPYASKNKYCDCCIKK